ncbi:beta-ketoacyl-[acyl-carrier-protein] synthase family protein [Microlunatus panaciterrae]|uniref:3-oxoacyl-[acyl-carrier-protein] synthase 2 n=1 Tax=Microlunatus panaciterrae TaxID=400768 RepID=A0ABS2RGE5_9ACTN|nr:beta-ketoacyl-[acyl-carrier-protein] synthase family protein [Microlunatus panaciterrae]MBM7797602.1 3-oxoacyl-[acyl-carrier-protein] synthase II [Microlunatus panaciterrae]
MSRTRVVVTGLGATTPLGGDVATTWAGMLAGRSGVAKIDADWAAELPVRIAAKAAVEPTEVLERVEARRLDRSAQLAVVAAMEAWKDAGFGLREDNPVDRQRLGVAIASGIGGMQTLLGNWDALRDKGPRRVSPMAIPMLMANAPAANVSLRLGAQAGVHTPVSACASSNESISLGLDMIRLGRADVVVVGGTEGVIHPLPLAAFGAMQAMSRRNDEPERASRPWDVDRDGFVLAEGSAVFVIETLEHAQARGARIYGELAGAGITADAHDIVQPDPSGTSQANAMVKALRESELTAADISHVNAHATSTPQGDVAEAGSIRQALGEHTEAVVTSTKSMTGHLLGGAGALESMATLLALRHRKVPPTINLDNPEPGLGIDIATSVRELGPGDLAGMNNSFGFGGHNVAVVFTNQYQNGD